MAKSKRRVRVRVRESGGTSSGDASRSSRGGSRAKRELWEWAKTLGLTLVFLVVIRTFLIQTFVVISESMEDTLLVGDFLVVNRVGLGARIPGTRILLPGYAEPERRDVLVFDPEHEDDYDLIKRLIGLPGDTLEMRSKELYLNGVHQIEPYVRHSDFDGDPYVPEMQWQVAHLLPEVDPATYAPTRDNWGPIVVPEGFYFFLGDNRDGSQDSRYWGVVERWRLMGKAGFLYYSYDRDARTPLAFFREARWDRIGRRIGQGSAPDSATTSMPGDTTWTVAMTGYGPIRIGDSLSEVEVALPGDFAPDEVSSECDYISPSGWPEGVAVMVVEGRVARIDVRSAGVATREGAQVGSTEREIQTLYPGRVEVQPHKYTDGHYLSVRSLEADEADYRLVFETDGERVEQFRAGLLPAVEWVEGCS